MVKKQKKNKKWSYWLLMLVLFVVAAIVVFLVWNACFKNKDEGQNSSVAVEIAEIEEQEKPQEQEVEVLDKPKVVQYDGEDPNSAEGLSGAITYAGFNDGRLMVRVNIDQYVDGGECRLDLKRGGVLIHEEVTGILGNASTASCDGFDVPVDIIGEGEVDIEIHLDSNGKTGIIKGETDV